MKSKCSASDWTWKKESDTFNATRWDAIDNVREIGNIGAHMEADVNLIIEIDPNEAQVLIELIEMLFEEWYVQKEQRRRKLDRLQNIAEKKQGQEREGEK